MAAAAVPPPGGYNEAVREELCSEQLAAAAAAGGVVWGLLKNYPPWPVSRAASLACGFGVWGARALRRCSATRRRPPAPPSDPQYHPNTIPRRLRRRKWSLPTWPPSTPS